MNRKQLVVIVLTIAIVSIASITFRSRAQSSPVVSMQKGLPEHVPYMFLFDHHNFNLGKAKEFENSGRDGTWFREQFKREAQLTDAQSVAFDQVTVECEKDLALQDATAKVVIDKFKSAYPSDGKLPAGVAPAARVNDFETSTDRNLV